MFKSVFLVIIFLYPLFINGQDLPKKVKYDSVKISDYCNRALIIKGKKYSVYDLVNQEYLIDPTKDHIHYFNGFGGEDSIDVYAVIGKKSQYYYVITKNGTKLEFNNRTSNNDLIILHNFGSSEEPFSILKFDNHHIDLRYNESMALEDVSKLRLYVKAKLSFYMLENNKAIVNNYREVIIDYDPEGDTVFFDGSNVFSGLYDLDSKTWIIPPEYVEIKQLNDYLFCRKIGDIDYIPEYFYYDFKYNYNLYSINLRGVELVKKDFTKIENELLSKVLNVNKVINTDDDLIYKTITDSGQSLIYFSLNNESGVYYSGTTELFLIYGKALKENYDFVQYSDEFRIAISINTGKIESHYIDDTQNAKSIIKSDKSILLTKDYLGFVELQDGSKIYSLKYNNDGVELLPDEPIYSIDFQYGLKTHNDSLIIITDYMFDFKDPEEYPIMSEMWVGEDSIDADGNLVFYPPVPGYEKSGIYNINTGEWILQPIYRHCLISESGYLMSSINRDEDGIEINEEYRFEDFKGTILFEHITKDSLFNNPELFKFLIQGFIVDTMFLAPTGRLNHSINRKNQLNYFVSKKQIGLYDPYFDKHENTINGIPLIEPKDFIHFSPTGNYMFYLEKDSIYLSFDSLLYAVSQKTGTILFDVKDQEHPSGYTIKLIEGSDTTIIQRIDDDFHDESPIVKNSITIINGKLIMNENCANDVHEEYFDDHVAFGIIERENSSIWKKINGIWTKVTPYYATIIENPLGYIVSTGGYLLDEPIIDEFEYYEWGEHSYKKTDIPASYMILDSNLNAISFLDWYDFPNIEDLGFGIKVCLDSGCFFVDYTGVAITDADWDEFELDGDKLKAINHPAYNYDEWEEIQFDEYGNEIQIEPDKIMYFDLPKK